MSAYSFRNSVSISSGVSGGTFRKLIFKSFSCWCFRVAGEKVIVNAPISTGSVQKVSINSFVPNSMDI